MNSSYLCLATICVLLGQLASPAQDITSRGNQMLVEMPGDSFQGEVPELSDSQNELACSLKKHVKKLSGELGERNVYKFAKLEAAAKYLESELSGAGYEVDRQTFRVRGRECANIVVELKGTDLGDQVVVVGGHYDSATGATGANDNGTGAAATVELAKLFAEKETRRTVRFVLFTNEEQPWFQSESMGSLVYARRCKKRLENVVAMFSLETMGYFSDKPNSQRYPQPLDQYYPSTGNFIAFVGDIAAGPLVSWTVKTFREQAQIPSQGAALPGRLPGVGWSDHWSFWQCGYRAVMVTDTAIYRYPHYHKKTDTVDKINFQKMTLVVSGLENVLEQLASPSGTSRVVTKARPAEKKQPQAEIQQSVRRVRFRFLRW